MRASAIHLHASHLTTVSRFGKARLRYMFTIEDVRLSCGSALLQPIGETPPTVSLTWKSGKKKAFAGVVRGVCDAEGAGARWTRPVSMACSLTSSKSERHRFEPRRSELSLRIEGAKASRRKLVGTLDLGAHASYERSTTKVTIPLEHGAGSLQLELTSAWVKKSVLDDDDETLSERTSNAGDDHEGSDESDVDVARRDSRVSDLAGVVEADERESGSAGGNGSGAHVPLSQVPAGSLGKDGAPSTGRGLVRSGSFGRLAERIGGVYGAGALGGGHRRVPSFGASVTKVAGASASSSASPPPPVPSSAAMALRLERKGSLSPELMQHALAVRQELTATAAPPPRDGLKRSNSFGSTATRQMPSPLGMVSGAKDDSETGSRSIPTAGLVRSASYGGGIGRSDPPGLSRPGGDGAASGSMFTVPTEAMEEVLQVELPLSMDALQESLSGFDCDNSRFGQALCRRLGYMQIVAGSWQGNEADGMRREVTMMVKLPPKPMLPDVTRVRIKHRLQRCASTMTLEREVWTLDVPYGETFCVQERWRVMAAEGGGAEGGMARLSVHTHVYFKSKGLLATKIKQHALKKSRKCAALASELLAHADPAVAGASPDEGAAARPVDEKLAQLREQYEALLEEASYYKNRTQQLERENKRLTDLQKYTRRNKRELSTRLVALEAELARERRERTAMEVTLTEAYTATLKDIVAQQEAASVARGAPAAGAKGHHRFKVR